MSIERDWSKLGIDFSAFDPPPESEAQPEPPPPAETVAVEIPDHPDHGLSKFELETLRTLYRKTLDEGHALHKCESPEQAQRWADYLNCHLPEDRHAAVIRKCELNSYTVRWNSPFPEMRRSGRGGDDTLP